MLKTERVDEVPEHLDPATIYLHVTDEALPPWSASMLCPCGCGDVICVPLDLAGEGPMWRLKSESPIHLEPSLQRTMGCRAHFFVHGGEFRMC